MDLAKHQCLALELQVCQFLAVAFTISTMTTYLPRATLPTQDMVLSSVSGVGCREVCGLFLAHGVMHSPSDNVLSKARAHTTPEH